jgi:hypothetical protein
LFNAESDEAALPESGLEQPVVVMVPATNPAIAADRINVFAVFVIMILSLLFSSFFFYAGPAPFENTARLRTSPTSCPARQPETCASKAFLFADPRSS